MSQLLLFLPLLVGLLQPSPLYWIYNYKFTFKATIVVWISLVPIVAYTFVQSNGVLTVSIRCTPSVVFICRITFVFICRKSIIYLSITSQGNRWALRRKRCLKDNIYYFVYSRWISYPFCHQMNKYLSLKKCIPVQPMQGSPS